MAMIILPWIICLYVVTVDCSILAHNEIPEDAVLRTPSLIKKYGYPVEVHHVQTNDGYILEMHRIPYGKNANDSTGPKKVVFLQHGLLASSADFVLIGPDKALAYLLADAGYDVWMGNARGNTYSRKHVRFDPYKNGRQFWLFSWHEIGVIDLPAMIDYVLKNTGQEKLYYMGHSQGTTTFYVMCAEKPEYNRKIIFMVSLAPVAYMGHMTSPMLRAISLLEKSLGVVTEMIGLNEFFPHSTLLSAAVNKACSTASPFKPLCSNSLFALCGFNPKELNETIIPLMSGHTPAGSSAMQIRHYGQGFISKKFRQFQHINPLDNLRLYGSLFPPEYNLKNIVAPIYIFYSRNDWLSHPDDVEQLCREVPNVVKKTLVADAECNHADYLYGIHVVKNVYKPILNLLETSPIK